MIIRGLWFIIAKPFTIVLAQTELVFSPPESVKPPIFQVAKHILEQRLKNAQIPFIIKFESNQIKINLENSERIETVTVLATSPGRMA
jgi:hypothetical protein